MKAREALETELAAPHVRSERGVDTPDTCPDAILLIRLAFAPACSPRAETGCGGDRKCRFRDVSSAGRSEVGPATRTRKNLSHQALSTKMNLHRRSLMVR